MPKFKVYFHVDVESVEPVEYLIGKQQISFEVDAENERHAAELVSRSLAELVPRNHPTCPKCGSGLVHRSVSTLLTAPPIRETTLECQSCGQRSKERR